MRQFIEKTGSSPGDERIHGPYRPADVRSGERIRCELRSESGQPGIVFEVWRLSPYGLELVANEDSFYAVGETVSIVLDMVGQRLTNRGVIVATDLMAGKRRLIALKLEKPAKLSEVKRANTREMIRWKCHNLFFPTVVVQNKFRFNDKMMFRVVDIAAGGLGLLTSMRNKYAVVGALFDARVQVPSVGEFKVSVRVVHIDVVDKGGVSSQVLGVKFVQPSKKCMAVLGQYILQFGTNEKVTPSPIVLKEQGFSFYSIADAVDCDVVRSEDEYRQVLELRSFAFQGVAGLGVTMTPEDMSDEYDSRARILVCRYRDKIIATLRLCFHGPGDNFEEEQYIKFPDTFPPRHLVVEASRAATHPDFRGSDLYLNMMRYTVLVVLQSGRRWIVQSTYRQLVPLYENLGFKRLGIAWDNPKCPGEQLHLFLGDCQGLIEGSAGNLIVWNAVVPEIAHLIEENEHVNIGFVAKKRLALYKALRPLYRIYEEVKLDRRLKRLRKS